jgi:hypothetical protein
MRRIARAVAAALLALALVGCTQPGASPGPDDDPSGATPPASVEGLSTAPPATDDLDGPDDY